MTREERIDWLCRLRSWVVAPPLMTAEQKSKFIEALTETIKAMQIEPCEDCISRQAVLECLDWYEHDRCEIDIYIREIVEDIKKLPSVQPKQRWIPCEKRMPEDSKSVLFCDIDEDIMIGYHVNGRPKTHFSENGSWEDIKNVRAWMPLPEPYVPDIHVGKMEEGE